MKVWEEQAKALFFIDHVRVGTIVEIVRKNRSTVSRFLASCPEYRQEVALRRERRAEERKQYQRDWDREHRPERYSHISGETMRQEHDAAVKELSRERYFG